MGRKCREKDSSKAGGPKRKPNPLGNLKKPAQQQVATFTHSKAHPKVTAKEPTTLMRGDIAGQDYTLTLYPDESDTAKNKISILLDGHSKDGERYAVSAGEHLGRLLEAKWTNIQDMCANGRTSALEALLRQMFAETDEMLRREIFPCFLHGGTTATVQLLVSGKHLVTANVGDTAAMLVYSDGFWQMLSGNHSADNPEEYERYRGRCARDGVEPQEFVFQRINCPGGNRLAGPNGDFKPIPIFKLNENGKAIPIEENCEYMGKLGDRNPKYYGGTQSIRKYCIRDEDGVAIGTQEDKRHCNWGSTVNGHGQSTRTLGDFIDKQELHLDAEPDVDIREIDPGRGPLCVLLASDGITDAHWWAVLALNLAAGMKRKDGAQLLTQLLVSDTLQNARDAGFKFIQGELDANGKPVEYPAWDDLSAVLTIFEPGC